MRGVSPVVAVLLLIMVAVGASVLIYLWLTGFAGKSTKTPSSLRTQFEIEAASITPFNGANASISLYLRNTGRASVDLSAVKDENALALYIYNSYTGDLVYSNTTLLKNAQWTNGEYIAYDVFNVTVTGGNTTTYQLVKIPVVIVKDGNGNGVWEPGEHLEITLRDLKLGSVPASTLALDGVTLACGHYYDIKVVIAGQEATIHNVRVNCQG